MSRIIKFRAWQKHYKEMLSHKRIEYGAAVELHNLDKDVVLMQYTGLKDKNGKEVYEGDRVTVGNSDPSEVYWDDEACQFRADDAFEHMPLGLLEVVGNIYETIKEG